MNEIEFKEQLELKIMRLSQNIWENKVDETNLNKWLENFTSSTINTKSCEQTSALYLLSNFMYFGIREIRELLKSLYRDRFFKPLIQEIRKKNQDTKNIAEINTEILEELKATKFLGIGNPSESGTHLLYFFRQENALGKEDFMHSHEIINIQRDNNTNEVKINLKYPKIKRYIFLDDVSGSGSQAITYSQDILSHLKTLNPNAHVSYFSLFATSTGLSNIRNQTLFDQVDCIFELDNSFKCFDNEARQYRNPDELSICKDFTRDFCTKYGLGLVGNNAQHALGYKDGQLLLGFSHNTPDNTLPVMWSDTNGWSPIFKRYNKKYGTKY